MRIPHISFPEVLHFTEVLAIVGAAIFAGFQLRALRLQNSNQIAINSADLTLRLDQDFKAAIN